MNTFVAQYYASIPNLFTFSVHHKTKLAAAPTNDAGLGRSLLPLHPPRHLRSSQVAIPSKVTQINECAKVINVMAHRAHIQLAGQLLLRCIQVGLGCRPGGIHYYFLIITLVEDDSSIFFAHHN
jgi:hypothetical protein